jgi:uncharacterized delta-60 repeat protein
MLGKTLQLAAAGNVGGDAYWIATLGGSGTEQLQGVTAASDGSVYVAGRTDSEGAGNFDASVVKYDSSGTLQWQRTIGGSGSEYAVGIAADSSGNIYAAGYQNSYGSAPNQFYLVKYNSSGTLQWQRSLVCIGTLYCRRVVVDSSDSNVYLAGFSSVTNSTSGGNDIFICKYSASGDLQWQRILGGSSTEFASGIGVDSSNNVYILFYTLSIGQGNYDMGLAKYNSSGVLQWQRTIGGTAFDANGGLAVDSSGNSYFCVETSSEGQGGTDIAVAKYNSSGVLQWQRIIGGTANENARSTALDSSGNVYVLGETNSVGQGDYDALIVKYNSSGTLQWQRSLGTTAAENGDSIFADGSGNIYLAGDTTISGNTDGLIVKLPADGSLTGTYGDFVYASTSLTAATSTLTDAASTLTDQESFYSGTIWDDVANASHVRFDDVNSGGNDVLGLFFKPDGTKVYMLRGNRTMIQTTLSTAWDISTHGSIDYTFPSSSFHFYHTLPHGLFISPDGTELYSLDRDYYRVHRYTMSTAWDLSTLSHTTAATGVSTQETGFRGICFSPDGLNMYYTGPSSDKIHRYTLSTAWDITTLSHDSSTTSTVDGFPSGLFIKEDGTRLYVVGLTGDKVYQFNPLTAYTLLNVLTSSTDIDSEFSIATEETSPTCLYISPDGDHMYVGGGIGNGIDQYSLPGSTTAPSLTDAASSLTSSKTDL